MGQYGHLVALTDQGADQACPKIGNLEASIAGQNDMLWRTARPYMSDCHAVPLADFHADPRSASNTFT